MISYSFMVQERLPVSPESREEAAVPRTSGRWIALLGWFFALGGGISLIVGMSDLQNLAVLTIVGVVLVPVGMLIVASGKILSGLAAIEKHTRTTAEATQKREADLGSKPGAA